MLRSFPTSLSVFKWFNWVKLKRQFSIWLMQQIETAIFNLTQRIETVLFYLTQKETRIFILAKVLANGLSRCWVFFHKAHLPVFKLFNLINNWNGNFHLTKVSSSKYIVLYSAEVSSMKPVLSKWFNLSKLIKVKPQISIWLAVIWFPTTLIRVSPV